MKEKEKESPLSQISLRSRLWLAFTFATFFPAAILFYYVVNVEVIPLATFGVLCFIILLGWWFIFDAFSSIEKIYVKSHHAISGTETLEAHPHKEVKNEVESLDIIFNTLSSKVKENMEELKEVTSKTEVLNRAISQKVNILSLILHTNILFSKGEGEENIFQLLSDRLKVVLNVNMVVTLLEKENFEGYSYFSSGGDHERINKVLESAHAGKFSQIQQKEVLDRDHPESRCSFLAEILECKNVFIHPLISREHIVGFLVAGAAMDDFAFSSDAYEVVELFSHYMGVVWEHQHLSRRVEDLETIDPLTGIYNEKFFITRLDEEINRASAYQRPCGVFVMELSNYEQCEEEIGVIELERVLKKIVRIVKENVRPIDILGRIKENQIGVIFIEKNKRQSSSLGQKISEDVYAFLKNSEMLTPRFTIAIAENPVDGTNAIQLFECIKSQCERG